jgi:hypothetical protein
MINIHDDRTFELILIVVVDQWITYQHNPQPDPNPMYQVDPSYQQLPLYHVIDHHYRVVDDVHGDITLDPVMYHEVYMVIEAQRICHDDQSRITPIMVDQNIGIGGIKGELLPD